jgi:hypothetical protein
MSLICLQAVYDAIQSKEWDELEQELRLQTPPRP